VAIIACVFDGAGVNVNEGVIVIVNEGDNIKVGIRVPVSVIVLVGMIVLVGVSVLVGVLVIVGVDVIVGVGGVPVTVNLPLTLHVSPTNICTSYAPGSHWSAGSLQSVYPNPPDAPFQGFVS
jgi:hypothetical protein